MMFANNWHEWRISVAEVVDGEAKKNVLAQVVADSDHTAQVVGAQPVKSNGIMMKTILFTAALLSLGILTANVVLINRQLSRLTSGSLEKSFYVLCSDEASATDRKSAFLSLVNSEHREWRSANMDKVDLSGTNIANANLDGLRIRESNLRDSDFSNCVLTAGSLSVSNMTDAVFDDADLSEANLFKAVLDKASLQRTKLTSASLSQATVHDANLVLAEFGEADLLMCDFTGSNLAGADLRGANLEAAKLNDCNIALARFDNAILTDTDFSDSNWWRARGLSSDQLMELAVKYPPTESNPSRLNDFEKWLESRAEE